MDLDINRLFTFELFYTLKGTLQISLPLGEMAVFLRKTRIKRLWVGIFLGVTMISLTIMNAQRKKVDN